jgi:hypothetical protein
MLWHALSARDLARSLINLRGGISNVSFGELLSPDMAAMLDRRAEWPDRGRMSRSYVERWHNPDTIAKAMVAAYRSPDSMFELNPNGPSPEAVTKLQG